MIKFFTKNKQLISHKIVFHFINSLELKDQDIDFIKIFYPNFNKTNLDLKEILSYICKRDRKKFKEKLLYLKKFDKKIDTIFRFTFPGQRIYYFRLLVFVKIKSFSFYDCIILDVTDDQDIKEKYQTLDSMLHESKTSVMIVEPDPYKKLKIVYVNEYFEEMTGYYFSEVYGKNPKILQGPETSKDIVNEIRFHIKNEKSFQCEIINYKVDHSIFWASLIITPIFNEENDLEYWMSLSRDITDQKKAEIENQKLMNEFIKTSKLQALGKMSSSVSHDFNNLLSAIGLYTDLIVESKGDFDEINTYSKNIKEIIYRANELTINLQSFAREVPSLKNKINLPEYLESTKSFLKLVLGKSNSLELYYWTKNIFIELDNQTLTHIFSNICMNAKDSFLSSGILEIHIMNANEIPIELENLHPDKKYSDYILMKFVDNGKGIQEEHLDRIFEPFFSTKPNGDANGLGLAGIYGIIKENNGHITVQSKVSIGTTFEIYLLKA